MNPTISSSRRLHKIGLSISQQTFNFGSGASPRPFQDRKKFSSRLHGLDSLFDIFSYVETTLGRAQLLQALRPFS